MSEDQFADYRRRALEQIASGQSQENLVLDSELLLPEERDELDR